MLFKRCLKIAPRLSGSHKSVLLLQATGLRAEEHLLATEIAKSGVLCGGLLFVIDGGLCEAYQEKTGTAGYSLLNNSSVLHFMISIISCYFCRIGAADNIVIGVAVHNRSNRIKRV